jgi:hypothetical protein
MFFSVANAWHEHGTNKHHPTASGTTRMGKKWANYYKNLDKKDIINTLTLEKIFVDYHLGFNYLDLVFWGIKNDT